MACGCSSPPKHVVQKPRKVFLRGFRKPRLQFVVSSNVKISGEIGVNIIDR